MGMGIEQGEQWGGCCRSLGDLKVTWARVVVQSGQTELTRVADGWITCKNERERRIKDDLKVFILSNWKNKVAKIGEYWGGESGGVRRLGLNIFSLKSKWTF